MKKNYARHRDPPAFAVCRAADLAIVHNSLQPNRSKRGRFLGGLPWSQNIELLGVKDPAIRLWYAEATYNYGWSRPVLVHQIEGRLHERQGQAVTNFDRVLPPSVRLSKPAGGGARARRRTSPRDPGKGPAAGAGKRVFVHWQLASPRCWRPGCLCRLALLSAAAALPGRG